LNVNLVLLRTVHSLRWSKGSNCRI